MTECVEGVRSVVSGDNLIVQIRHRAISCQLVDPEDAEENLRDLLLEFSYSIQGLT